MEVDYNNLELMVYDHAELTLLLETPGNGYVSQVNTSYRLMIYETTRLYAMFC